MKSRTMRSISRVAGISISADPLGFINRNWVE
jgi:hypothetical protein